MSGCKIKLLVGMKNDLFGAGERGVSQKLTVQSLTIYHIIIELRTCSKMLTTCESWHPTPLLSQKRGQVP